MDWYEENIEEPIRDVVKLLRDNGFNTTCSCGHEMYVEGELIIEGDLNRLHKLLYDYYCDKRLKPNYEITFTIKVQEGFIFQNYFYIKFNT
jgi:hypothetical protein